MPLLFTKYFICFPSVFDFFHHACLYPFFQEHFSHYNEVATRVQCQSRPQGKRATYCCTVGGWGVERATAYKIDNEYGRWRLIINTRVARFGRSTGLKFICPSFSILNPFRKRRAALWPGEGHPKTPGEMGRYFLVLQQRSLSLAASCAQPERHKKHVSKWFTLPLHRIVLLHWPYWPRPPVNGEDKSITSSRPTSTTFLISRPHKYLVL